MIINNKSAVLLLTCCVDPQGMSYTKINDKNIRIQQYYEAFDFYLESTNYKLLIVENTLFEIDSKYLNNDRIEYLTFEGNNFDKLLGKGYGEALILEYALKNSEIIKSNLQIKIVKITGRLKVLNINDLINQVLSKKKGECVCADLNWKMNFVYSYFFIANSNFFNNYFLPNKAQINDTKRIYFEHILLDALKKYKKSGFCFKLFQNSILISGVSASTGIHFSDKSSKFDGIRQYIKVLLSNFV